MAEKNPETYEPDLAASCNNLANLLSGTNRIPEAEALYQEALEVYRRLAEKNPETYEPDLAASCNNLAILYKNTNRFPEAETLYQEALEIRRRLAEKAPEAYEPSLADSCYNLAILLFKVKHDKPASKALFEQVLAIYEKYPHLASDADDVRSILSRYF